MVQSPSLSPPTPPNCYLAFSRSRREPGPSRKQPLVAHVCALKTWSGIKGMWQALCLIYNIISNISMSQTATAKQCLMIQTHKTHTGWEWEVKTAQQRRQMMLGALVVDSFPQGQAAGKGFSCLILPFICPEGVMLQPAKLYFNISASRGPWQMSFSALLSHWASVLQLHFSEWIIYHNQIVFCQVR